MELKSSTFSNHQEIPRRYTGEGEDLSPPLTWADVPKECRSFALICEDPDAPKRAGQDHPFVHWLIYNISPAVTELPEALPKVDTFQIPLMAAQGKNSFQTLGYAGPMPPEGHGVHRYEFTLYALATDLQLEAGLTKEKLMGQIRPDILMTAQLVGLYERVAKQMSA